MKKASLFVIGLLLLFHIEGLAQESTRETVLDDFINAFNNRDLNSYVSCLHDSVKIFTFPNELSKKNKAEVREAYSSAFNAKELTGTIKVVGKKVLNELYIQEQSLEGFNSTPVLNYVIYRFSGEKIIEIWYLPKNYSLPGN